MEDARSCSAVSGEIDDGIPTADELVELRGEVVADRFMLGELIRSAPSIIFRATDLLLQRVAALELLVPPERRDWTEIDLMRSTAAVARRIRDHERARIIDWGTDGDVAYVAVETDDGGDPTELLCRREANPDVRIRSVGEGGAEPELEDEQERPESLLGSGADRGRWKRRLKLLAAGTSLMASLVLLAVAGWWGLSEAHAELDDCGTTPCWQLDTTDYEATPAVTARKPNEVTKSVPAKQRNAPPSAVAPAEKQDHEQKQDTTPNEAAESTTDPARLQSPKDEREPEPVLDSHEAAASNDREDRPQRAKRSAKRRRPARGHRRRRAAPPPLLPSPDSSRAPAAPSPEPARSIPSVTDLEEPEESDFRRRVDGLPDKGAERGDVPYLANPFPTP